MGILIYINGINKYEEFFLFDYFEWYLDTIEYVLRLQFVMTKLYNEIQIL